MSKSKKKTQRRAKAVIANPTAAPAASGLKTASTVSSGTREFTPDYTYVKQDLRRIGVLAGSLIVALIILSFFLH